MARWWRGGGAVVAWRGERGAWRGGGAVVAWRHPPTGNTRRRGAGVKGEGISQHL